MSMCHHHGCQATAGLEAAQEPEGRQYHQGGGGSIVAVFYSHQALSLFLILIRVPSFDDGMFSDRTNLSLRYQCDAGAHPR